MAVNTAGAAVRKRIGAAAADRALREDVAWGCRVLHLFGHEDMALGHVSARRPGTETMWMKGKGLGLDEVTPTGVVPIDFQGRRLAGTHPIHLELTLHTGVYQARPDVGAVVHTHPRYATALGATGQALEIVSHDGVLFAGGLALFDETPVLITDTAQGAAIAKALGPHQAVLIKNHGILTVGPTVPWAVFAAVVLERAAQMQAYARGFGVPQPIPDAIARAMLPTKYNDALIEEYWRYFKRHLRARGLARGMRTS